MDAKSELVCQYCMKLGIYVFSIESKSAHVEWHLNVDEVQLTPESTDEVHKLCFPIKDSKVVCDICDVEFESISVLEEHTTSTHFKVKPTPNKVVHSKIKSLSCGSCGKKFKSKPNRVRHEKAVHLKLKPYHCQFCQLSFSQSGHRIAHEKQIHLKFKEISCGFCSKKFGCNGNRIKHERRVHMKEKGFPCNICHKAFSQNSHRITHERTVHMKEKGFSCNICHKAFSQNSHRIIHEKNVHSVTHPTIRSSQDKSAKLGETVAQLPIVCSDDILTETMPVLSKPGSPVANKNDDVLEQSPVFGQSTQMPPPLLTNILESTTGNKTNTKSLTQVIGLLPESLVEKVKIARSQQQTSSPILPPPKKKIEIQCNLCKMSMHKFRALAHVWKHLGNKKFKCSACPYMAGYGRRIIMIRHVKCHQIQMNARLIDNGENMKEEFNKLAKVMFPGCNVKMA